MTSACLHTWSKCGSNTQPHETVTTFLSSLCPSAFISCVTSFLLSFTPSQVNPIGQIKRAAPALHCTSIPFIHTLASCYSQGVHVWHPQNNETGNRWRKQAVMWLTDPVLAVRGMYAESLAVGWVCMCERSECDLKPQGSQTDTRPCLSMSDEELVEALWSLHINPD